MTLCQAQGSSLCTRHIILRFLVSLGFERQGPSLLKRVKPTLNASGGCSGPSLQISKLRLGSAKEVSWNKAEVEGPQDEQKLCSFLCLRSTRAKGKMCLCSQSQGKARDAQGARRMLQGEQGGTGRAP